MEESKEQDILTIVDGINKLIDKHGGEENLKPMNLKLSTNGKDFWIDFLGTKIWTSKEDVRPIDSETGEKDPVDLFLLKTMFYMLKTFANVGSKVFKELFEEEKN